MTPAHYFIYVEASAQFSISDSTGILNMAGKGFISRCRIDLISAQYLFIIHIPKNNGAAIEKYIKSLPLIKEVLLIPISKPVSKKELLGVRGLFWKFDLDSERISDTELIKYINSEFQKNGNYSLNFDPMEKRGRVQKVTINKKSKLSKLSPCLTLDDFIIDNQQYPKRTP